MWYDRRSPEIRIRLLRQVARNARVEAARDPDNRTRWLDQAQRYDQRADDLERPPGRRAVVRDAMENLEF